MIDTPDALKMLTVIYDNAGHSIAAPEDSVMGLPCSDGYAPFLDYNLSLTDESIVKIDEDFQMTGKEFKRCLKVLMKIVENDYPEELL